MQSPKITRERKTFSLLLLLAMKMGALDTRGTAEGGPQKLISIINKGKGRQMLHATCTRLPAWLQTDRLMCSCRHCFCFCVSPVYNNLSYSYCGSPSSGWLDTDVNGGAPLPMVLPLPPSLPLPLTLRGVDCNSGPLKWNPGSGGLKVRFQ